MLRFAHTLASKSISGDFNYIRLSVDGIDISARKLRQNLYSHAINFQKWVGVIRIISYIAVLIGASRAPNRYSGRFGCLCSEAADTERGV